MTSIRLAHTLVLSLGLAGLAACTPTGPDETASRDAADASAPVPATGQASATDAAAQRSASPAAAPGNRTAMSASPEERGALGVLNAINEHEIAAGEQALTRNVPEDVAAYARMMIEQHTDNRTRTSALDPDMAAADARAQSEKSTRELATLEGMTGDAYAAAYVKTMVKDHTEALAALDEKLIPRAKRADIQSHLTMSRDHVAQHLELAKALQAKMN